MASLKLGFSHYTDVELYSRGFLVASCLSSGKGLEYFPAPDPPVSSILNLSKALETVLTESETDQTDALKEFYRKELIVELKRLGMNLELACSWDAVKLSVTGYELKSRPEKSDALPLAPMNVRAEPTGFPGQAKVLCDGVKGKKIYQAVARRKSDGHETTLDPMSNGRKILFTNLDRGEDYEFQVRAIGSNGPGPWSDVATMMVV